MGKKQYEKPAIRDFIPPSVHGDISPMGMCSTGTFAGGPDSCETGIDVRESGSDCGTGSDPVGYCSTGNYVGNCSSGTAA